MKYWRRYKIARSKASSNRKEVGIKAEIEVAGPVREIILNTTTNGEKHSASEMILTAGTTTNVPVKSKLQHPPPAGQRPGI